MLGNFEMLIKHFQGNEDITILPVADVHFGAIECHEKEWREFASSVMDRPHTYLVIGGDMIDNATKTCVATPWDDYIRPKEQKRLMVEMLKPLAERILCMVPGNHENRNRDVDDEPLYDIACKLDIENIYRPDMAFLKIQCGNLKGDGRHNPTYMVCVAHGNGSSIYVGGAAAKAERFGMSVDGIDLMITGHTHKPAEVPNAKIKVDATNNIVSIKPWHNVICSSWLGYAGYAARKLLPPTVTARQQIILHGDRKAIDVITGT